MKYFQFKGKHNNENDEPLFTLSHYHPGVSRKAPISVEFVLLVLIAAAVYYATTLKNQFKN